jgi:hypothetical protein
VSRLFPPLFLFSYILTRYITPFRHQYPLFFFCRGCLVCLVSVVWQAYQTRPDPVYHHFFFYTIFPPFVSSSIMGYVSYGYVMVV